MGTARTNKRSSGSSSGRLKARGSSPPLNVPGVIGDFHVVCLLGSGTTSEVYLAQDAYLGRPVALKVATDVGSGDDLLVEAWAASHMSHQNLVTVYHSGYVNGRVYLATEYVDGWSFDRVRKPMNERKVIDIAIGLCRGLGVAHAAGILHRDIKPANAVVGRDGTPKLLDFGLAKPINAAAAHDWPLPEADDAFICGTPHYIAPEVWAGESGTEQSDIYSLGALLFELCAGRAPCCLLTPAASTDLPFRELAQLVCTRDIPSLGQVRPGIDRRLAATINRCLTRKQKDRIESTDELIAELENCLRPASRRRASTEERAALAAQ